MEINLVVKAVILSVLFGYANSLYCCVGYELATLAGGVVQNISEVRCPNNDRYRCRRTESALVSQRGFEGTIVVGSCSTTDECKEEACNLVTELPLLSDGITVRFCQSSCCYGDSCNKNAIATFDGEEVTSPARSFRNCSRADVALFVDSSNSIDSQDFENIQSFLYSLIFRLDVSLQALRVSLLTFNQNVMSFGSFFQSDNRQSLVEQIERIRYTGGRKRLSGAFAYARDNVFRADQGDRRDAVDMMIIFTDGRSRYNIGALRRLKRRGIRVAIVTVGDRIDRSQVNAIASDPDSDNVFDLDDVDRLADVIEEFSRVECPVGTQCYLGGSHTEEVEIDECPFGTRCAGIEVITGRGESASQMYTGLCVHSFFCHHFTCDLLQLPAQHSFCRAYCCDGDLCNDSPAPPTGEAETTSPSVDQSQEAPRCYVGYKVNGLGPGFTTNSLTVQDCPLGTSCAGAAITSFLNGSHIRYEVGACVPTNVCPSFNCESDTIRSIPVFGQIRTCRVICCQENFCNTPPTDETELPNTGREALYCYSGMARFGNFAPLPMAVRCLNADNICASASALVLETSGTRTEYLLRQCIAPSQCASFNCAEVLSRVGPLISGHVLNCTASCCDQHVCNPPVPIFVDDDEADEEKPLDCVLGTQASGYGPGIDYNLLIPAQCPVGTSCAQATLTSLFRQTEVQVTIGSCYASDQCPSLNCNSPGIRGMRVLGQLLNCTASCCEGNLCDSLSTP